MILIMREESDMTQLHWDRNACAAAARKAAAEGIVLLKNDRDTLPLREGERVALFGRAQFNYYKSGTGSGGLVNTDYVVGIRDALFSADRDPFRIPCRSFRRAFSFYP